MNGADMLEEGSIVSSEDELSLRNHDEVYDAGIGSHSRERIQPLPLEDYQQFSSKNQTSGDIDEQRQAIEQARLLSRFEELRLWQQQQQQQLMLQQQAQLQQLQSQQQNIHMLIAKKRQSQWGGQTDNLSDVTDTKNSQSHNLSPRGGGVPSPRQLGGLSQANTHGTVAVANPGRPLPNFVNSSPTRAGEQEQDLDDYDESASQYLNSESNTGDDECPSMDDGIYPIPDSGSERSDFLNGYVNKAVSRVQDIAAVQMNKNNHQTNSRVNVNSHQINSEVNIHQTNSGVDVNFNKQFAVDHRRLKNDESDTNTAVLRKDIPCTGNAGNNYNSNCNPPNLTKISTCTSLNPNRSHLNSHSNPNCNTNQNMINSNLRTISSNVQGNPKSSSVSRIVHFADEDRTGSIGNGSSRIEPGIRTNFGEFQQKTDDYDEDDCDVNETSLASETLEERAQDNELIIPFDDIPVVGAVGGRRRTFEELIEDELRKESAQNSTRSSAKTNETKCSFLKRGEGVARFKGGASNLVLGNQSKPGVPMKESTPIKKSSMRNTTQNKRVLKGDFSKSKSKLDRMHIKQTAVKTLQLIKPTVNTTRSVTSTVKSAPQTAVTTTTLMSAGSLSKTTTISTAGKKNTGGTSAGVTMASEKVFDNGNGRETNRQDTTECHVQSGMKDHGLKKKNSNEDNLTGNRPADEIRGSLGTSVDHDDLAEFEFLERYAEDNSSFLSNVSAVNRILSQNKIGRGTTVPRGSANVPSNADNSQHRTLAQQKNQKYNNISEVNDDDDELCDETLRKSDNDCEEDETVSKGTGSDQHRSVITEKINEQSRKTARSKDEAGESSNYVNHTDALMKRNMGEQIGQGDWKLRDVSDVGSDVVSSSDDEDSSSGEEEGDDNEEKSRNESIDTDWQRPDNHGDHPVRKSELEMGCEEGNKDEENDGWNFRDDEVWDEASFQRKRSGANSAISRKKLAADEVTLRPNVNQHSSGQSEDVSAPPISQLVAKLFPKLKEEKVKPPLQPEHAQKLEAIKNTEIGDGIQSKVLREKLAELETEIETFRRENAALSKLRTQRELDLDTLKKEMAKFETQKNDELKRLETFTKEETRKLKKERKLFEDYQRATRAQPDRKDRSEIDTLKAEIERLKEEGQKRETRWGANTTRLRDRIEALEAENVDLKQQVHVMEQRRLEIWQEKPFSQKDHVHTISKVSRPSDHDERDAVKTKPPSNYSKEVLSNEVNSSAAMSSVTSSSVRVQGGRTDDDGNRELISDYPQHSTVHTPAFNPMSLSIPRPLLSVPNPSSSNIIPTSSFNSNAVVSSKQLTSSDNPRTSDSNVPAVRNAPNISSSTTHTLYRQPCPFTSRSDDVGCSTEARGSLPRKTAVIPQTTDGSTTGLDKGDEQYKELHHTDGKLEKVYTNGTREILFSNGTRKQISADGQSIIVSFFNGDIKQILPDQRVVYYYADAQTSHTTYPDGLEVLQFPNQQVEKHYPDGTREIVFPDQTIKYVFPTGLEESIFTDGTVIRTEKNGDKVMEFTNGQREIHTEHYKRREYPDGTVKTVYPDGRQETRYSSGRLRVKNKDGQIIVDQQL